MQKVYSLIILSLYLIILAGLDFITTLDFKALIDLDFRVDFRATLEAAAGLIFNTIIKDLVFQVALGAVIRVTLRAALEAINIAALGAEQAEGPETTINISLVTVGA